MSKNYKQILPVNDQSKVITQFGRLPLSIMEFVDSPKWNCAYFEQNEDEKRRSDNAEYLPGLGLSEFSSSVIEFILRYWSMRNSKIIDPFAGRATRAIITEKLKRNYEGYEISKITYDRSIEHFRKNNVTPTLHLSDGCKLEASQDNYHDLCVTCSPYHQLEKYESCDGQLSDIKRYDDFLRRIDECIFNINRVLKQGAFCCWVCADWRTNDGFKLYSHDSIELFKKNNMTIHDIVIIKNHSPFAALQAAKAASKRVTSKIHEYIIVAKKKGEYVVPDYCESDEINEKSLEFFG